MAVFVGGSLLAGEPALESRSPSTILSHKERQWALQIQLCQVFQQQDTRGSLLFALEVWVDSTPYGKTMAKLNTASMNKKIRLDHHLNHELWPGRRWNVAVAEAW